MGLSAQTRYPGDSYWFGGGNAFSRPGHRISLVVDDLRAEKPQGLGQDERIKIFCWFGKNNRNPLSLECNRVSAWTAEWLGAGAAAKNIGAFLGKTAIRIPRETPRVF